MDSTPERNESMLTKLSNISQIFLMQMGIYHSGTLLYGPLVDLSVPLCTPLSHPIFDHHTIPMDSHTFMS